MAPEIHGLETQYKCHFLVCVFSMIHFPYLALLFSNSQLHVFAIKLVTFAVDFVPLAVEFGTFAVEFVGFAVEFVTLALYFVALAIELDAFAMELGVFVLDFVAFALEFIMAIMTAACPKMKGHDTFTKSVCDLKLFEISHDLNLICDLKVDLKIYKCLPQYDLCNYYWVLK